ncbi:MAG: hypothetical protein EPO32_09345 [Anaerolineae bacterium]|nr:MAG: hypothetical protein EPO32_09345 [Anaerolineae bacterium]
MQKGPHLADGRTAEVFAWGDDRILKLFRPGWDSGAADYEFEVASAVQATGYPCPQVFERVKVEKRPGILYQRIQGRPLLADFQKSPWRFPALARRLARLHAEMHTRTPEGLPDAHAKLKRRIAGLDGATEEQRIALLARLDSLPRGDRLLHGDFHLENVYDTPDGPMVLDWVDAACGHPLADVARSVLLLQYSYVDPATPGYALIQLVRRLFTRVYLSEYFRHSPHPRADLRPWFAPVFAARLREDIAGEVETLVPFIEHELAWNAPPG